MRNYPAPITDRRIRIALAGCGRIAKNHFAAMRAHEDRVKLTGVCDVDPAALAAAAQETGAAPFSSLRAMLAGCEADLVITDCP